MITFKTWVWRLQQIPVTCAIAAQGQDFLGYWGTVVLTALWCLIKSPF
jgi:hypothetical protein